MHTALSRESPPAVSPQSPSGNLDDYLGLHQMMQQDLHRATTNITETREEHELRVAAEAEVDIFTPECVEQDRQRGVDHVAKMRDVVGQQEAVYRDLMFRVRENDEKTRHSRTASESRTASFGTRPYGLKGEASVRTQHACSLANELVSRKAKHDSIQQAKLAIAAESVKALEVLQNKQDEVERRVTKRQADLLEARQEKTFLSQQKRNEQQKMLKEIQRDDDHRFEMLQLKHHPAAVSTQKDKTHDKLPPVSVGRASSPNSSMGSSAPASREARRSMSEPVFRDIVQSHKKYVSTLHRWQTFEAENERRTEAYWRKMLQGDTRRKHDSRERRASLGSTLKKTIKEVTAIRKFVNRAKGDGQDIDPFEQIEAVDTVNFSEDSLDVTLLSPGGASTSTGLGSSMRLMYDSRRENAKVVHEDADRLAREKRERDTAYLEEKRRLGKAFQQNKAAQAGETVKAWEKRNAATAIERQKQAVQNNGDFERKMQAAQERLDGLEAKLGQERAEISENRSDLRANNKASAEQQLQEKCNRIEEERQAQDDRGAEMRNDRLSAEGQDSGYREKAQERYEKKKANDRAFRRQAVDEIKSKDQRHQEAVKRNGRPANHAHAMAQHRLKRSDKGRDQPGRAPPPELTLPPELALEPGLFLSPKSAGSPAALLPEDPTTPKGEGCTSGDRPTVEALEQQILEAQATRNSPHQKRATPSSMLSMSGGMASSEGNFDASAGGNSSRRSSKSGNLSGSDSEGEADFLTELQSRSGAWLADLRREADNNLKKR